jgi:Ca-activated chloride channel homolog
MFQFGNYTYLVYIASVSAVTLALFLFYLMWRRRAVSLLSRGIARDHLIRGSETIVRIKQVLVILAIIMCALVVLRPQWGEQVREVHNEGSDVLIALDVSPSMLAQDVKPSRLERAKDAVRWIVESLKGDRVGLILFSGDAFLQCPLTNDYGAFMMFLDAASPDSIYLKGTDIGMALRQAYRVFKNKRLTSHILVLITDGEDHEGTAEETAKQFRGMDVAIYTVGIGRTGGEVIPSTGDENTADSYYRDNSGTLIKSRKDPSFLKRIAGMTQGVYIDISDSLSGLHNLLDVIADQQKNRYGSRIIKEPREQYQIFAFILLLLLSVELMLSERKNEHAMSYLKRLGRSIYQRIKREPGIRNE